MSNNEQGEYTLRATLGLMVKHIDHCEELCNTYFGGEKSL